MKGLLLCYGCLLNWRVERLFDNCICCGIEVFLNDCVICKLFGIIGEELDNGIWDKIWCICKFWFFGFVVVVVGIFVNFWNNFRILFFECDFWCKRLLFLFIFKICIII